MRFYQSTISSPNTERSQKKSETYSMHRFLPAVYLRARKWGDRNIVLWWQFKSRRTPNRSKLLLPVLCIVCWSCAPTVFLYSTVPVTCLQMNGPAISCCIQIVTFAPEKSFRNEETHLLIWCVVRSNLTPKPYFFVVYYIYRMFLQVACEQCQHLERRRHFR